MSDRKLVLTVGGVMLLIILVVGIFTPKAVDDDPRPTTTNNGPRGAKAAYLVLEKMGRVTSRWNHSVAELNGSMDDAQAERATLVLAEPTYDATELLPLRKEIARFLERGGRVLVTGGAGAQLLPEGGVKPAAMLQDPICKTTPEGPGQLAAAGSVEMPVQAQWDSERPGVEVEQRCGSQAVVVRYAVGTGEAVWWSSAAPLTNDELKDDGALKLLLASVGEGRDVVFDESLHGVAKTLWDAAAGLPIHWLEAQAGLLFLLLVVSFSRRNGPLRSPVVLPRSSPVEFAVSMGDLYEKAGATSAATEAAKRRLLRVLTREAGVSHQSVQQGPEAIAEALQARLGGDWSKVRLDLVWCQDMAHGKVSAQNALGLVKALRADAETVRARLKPPVIEAVVDEAAV